MRLETKYEVGDKVYFERWGAIAEGTIEGIRIDVTPVIKNCRDVHVRISYTGIAKAPNQETGRFDLKEYEIFSTKQEAAMMWLEKQGLGLGVTDL